MELILLPVLALLGLVFLVDFDGGDDSDDGDTSAPDPAEPTPPPADNVNRIMLGREDDTETGTDAQDFIFSNDGDDTVSGGAGDDKIFLGAGQDTTTALNDDGSFDIDGMMGDDLIRGGEGRDTIIDTIGSNTVYGDTGFDRINTIDDDTSAETPDTVFGGFGNDTIFADDGDVVTGGAGEDRFQLIADVANDPVIVTDYEDGDTFLLRDAQGSLIIQERISVALDANGEDTNMLVDGETVVVLQGVTEVSEGAITNAAAPPLFGEREFGDAGENGEAAPVVSDDFDDTLLIGEFGTQVVGFGGDDDIRFEDGQDTEGRDITVNGGSGDDTIVLGAGDDLIMGGLGADVITGGTGSDEITGGFGNDVITTTSTTDQLDAADTVFGDEGNDEFFADNGDAITGGIGNDDFNLNMTNADAAAVTIQDFNPASETIAVDVALDQTTTPAVTFEIAQGGIGTNVLVEDRVAVLLIGVEPADLTAENVVVTNTAPPVAAPVGGSS